MSEPGDTVTGPGPAGPPWWALLPPADVQVTCGEATHRLRWADGRLTALDHPDAEGELVLAALGGDRPRCVGLVESWGRRADDLEVLAVGPRSAADELRLTPSSADDSEPPPAHGGGGWYAYAPLTARTYPAGRAWPWLRRPGPTAAMLAARRQRAVSAVAARRLRGGGTRRARWQHVRDEADRAAGRRAELLSLLALGPEFQMRLSATVATAWAEDGRRDGARPALTAALAGRLAPAAQTWLEIDPGRVDVSLHEDAGWGRLAMPGDRLDAALPASWLATVWAPGLAVIGGYLVVEVTEAAWPDATVLAVPWPGTAPAILNVRATGNGWTMVASDPDGYEGH